MKIMEMSSSSARCDWLEVSLSLGSFRELESSSWFKNIKNQGSPEWSKKGKKWTLNGHMLFYKTENSPPRPSGSEGLSDFEGRVTATGRLADELLELLSKFLKMSSESSSKAEQELLLPLPFKFKVRRLDIKTEIEIPKGIKNWENIRKRQAAEESKKNKFARNVQLITSGTGTTLAIGTRGKSKTYCRLEVRRVNVSLELEYRHEKAEKIGKTLLKSKNPSSLMKFYLKEYLKSLVSIRNITRPLLTQLSEIGSLGSKLGECYFENGNQEFLNKKKEYCESTIFPFLRKMLENPQMKEWIIVKISALLRSKG